GHLHGDLLEPPGTHRQGRPPRDAGAVARPPGGGRTVLPGRPQEPRLRLARALARGARLRGPPPGFPEGLPNPGGGRGKLAQRHRLTTTIDTRHGPAYS